MSERQAQRRFSPLCEIRGALVRSAPLFLNDPERSPPLSHPDGIVSEMPTAHLSRFVPQL